MNCDHRRLKRNFPFGRNSRPIRVCKARGDLVTGRMIQEKIKKAKMENKKWRK